MVQAGYSNLPYGIYADNAVVPWTNDIPDNMLLGLGIMLAANEVPRIAQHSGLQKGNYRKIKGLSVLFARIKRKYIANGGCRNAVAVAFCSQGAMQNISLFRKYLLRTG